MPVIEHRAVKRLFNADGAGRRRTSSRGPCEKQARGPGRKQAAAMDGGLVHGVTSIVEIGFVGGGGRITGGNSVLPLRRVYLLLFLYF